MGFIMNSMDIRKKIGEKYEILVVLLGGGNFKVAMKV